MKYRIVTYNGKYRIQREDYTWIDNNGISECNKVWIFQTFRFNTKKRCVPKWEIFESEDLEEAKNHIELLIKDDEKSEQLKIHEAGPWEVVE